MTSPLRKNTLFRLLLGTAAVLCASAAFALGAVSLFSYSSVTLTSWAETIRIVQTPFSTVLIFIAAAVLMMAAMRCFRRLNNTLLFIVLSVVYTALAAWLILSSNDLPRADPLLVFVGAWDVNNGIFQNFEPGTYFAQYPHQLGLLTYERILTKLVPTIRVLYGANLVGIIVTNLMLWKMTAMLVGKDAPACRASILLSFLFAPSLFFVLFLYGTIPGMCMTALGAYCWMKTESSEKKLLWWIGCIAAMTLAVLLRKNCLIAVIAISVLTALRMLRDRNLKPIAAILLLALCTTQAGNLLTAFYARESGQELGKGFPVTYWAAMGLQDQDQQYGRRGWFNGYDGVLIGKVGFDYDAADEIAKADIAESLSRFANDPAKAADFFGYKIVSMWCDPLYESIISGPQRECSQTLQSEVWQTLYDGKGAHDAVRTFSHVIMTMIFLFSAVGVMSLRPFRKKDGDVRPCFFALYFLGGVLFHIVWEAKSQYAYPYIVLLIPCAAMGLQYVVSLLPGKRSGKLPQE